MYLHCPAFALDRSPVTALSARRDGATFSALRSDVSGVNAPAGCFWLCRLTVLAVPWRGQSRLWNDVWTASDTMVTSWIATSSRVITQKYLTRIIKAKLQNVFTHARHSCDFELIILLVYSFNAHPSLKVRHMKNDNKQANTQASRHNSEKISRSAQDKQNMWKRLAKHGHSLVQRITGNFF